MSRRTVEDWRREVFRSQSPDMTAAAKVLCLYLVDHVDRRTMYISVPRDEIAKALGIHNARVAERMKRACDAGFLHSVSSGYLRHTAVYKATFPDVVVARPCVQQSGTHMDTAPSDATRYVERYASNPGAERETDSNAYRSTGRHNYNGPVPATDRRDVGIDEKGAAAPVVDALRRGATEDREASA